MSATIHFHDSLFAKLDWKLFKAALENKQ